MTQLWSAGRLTLLKVPLQWVAIILATHCVDGPGLRTGEDKTTPSDSTLTQKLF